MIRFGSEKIGDVVILVARVLLVVLFLTSGWDKLMNYSGTVAYMAQSGAPLPPVSAVLAIIVELFVSAAILIGALTRPLAVLMSLYTLITALIGHRYWTMTGAAQAESMINFYKNVSIMGGFLLLYVTGAGRYSADALLNHNLAWSDTSQARLRVLGRFQ